MILQLKNPILHLGLYIITSAMCQGLQDLGEKNPHGDA